MHLGELTIPIQKLKGVGPAVQRDLAGLGISTAADLLLHLPRDYEDRSEKRPLVGASPEGNVNTVAFVEGHEYFGPPGPKRTLKILVRDETAKAELVCFGRNFLAQAYPPGMKVRLAGFFQRRFGRLQSSSFDIEEYGDDEGRFSSVLPIYPLSGRLSQKTLRKLVRQTYEKFAVHLEDGLPAPLASRLGLLPLREALGAVHFPEKPADAEAGRRSLAFRELFSLQLSIARRAWDRRTAVRPARSYGTGLRDRLIRGLPFELTPDQRTCVDEIAADVSRDHPMARLLQGDVGSGKTLVAFLSSLPFAEAGRQTALMAPTELLARQHADNAARLLAPLGIRLAYYSGSVPSRARRPLLDALAAGEIDLIVGTHALFSDDVEYRDLGLVVIDEQHRFGVSQRNRLTAKGLHPDVLVMSATPIPRTLALSAFGDLDVSTLRTMPPGRKPVVTHLAAEGKERKVYDWVRKELEAGRQAYFVYPLIEGTEKRDLKDAETMYGRLKAEIFPDFPVGLIHSRIPEEEKRKVMEDFSRGAIKVLAATSVVEVGVDVPNATCMVVEHAERFGLSALHQLRGRVGRGPDQAYAFLIFEPGLTEIGKKRLLVMKNTTDGFRIAEEDLLLRGPGEMLGVRQSGLLDFRTARLPGDEDLMLEARKEAYAIIERDPGLIAPEHAGLGAEPTAEGRKKP